VTPFTLRVADDAIADLRNRLARTRFPDQPPGEPWATGTDLAYLRDLVAYWRDGFDWRAHEAALNAYPQFKAPVAGIDLHFLRAEGVGPNPMPLLLLHGWPGSIFEFLEILPMLTDPARFGGDPADSFTVIAPSLPGYGLSFAPGQPRFGIAEIGAAVATLMTDVLGIPRFAVQGGDWGGATCAWLGAARPESLIGLHVNFLPLPRENLPPPEDAEDARYREEMAHWVKEETGYAVIQGTKPQTLACALTDSPAGLAAWIAEKFRSWSDEPIDRDRMLADISLYWFTGAIGSSFWPYYARAHGPWPIPGPVTAPAGYAQFPREILRPPRAFAARTLKDIRRWTVMPKGGHFAAMEQPALLAGEIRAFFREFR